MNVVIYARFSSHSQTEQSIEGQLAVCRLYAKDNNYNIIHEYIDEAISGTTDNRPAFKQMIEDSNKKIFEFVLVYQLDRFARNRYDSATYKAKLKKNGVRVLSAKENISDDASGILMEGLLESMAEYYSAELSQKVRRGMDINAQKCLSTGGNIALGYIIDNKKFVIDNNNANIVKEIFNMYVSGKTVKQICDVLNSRQIKTSRGVAFNKNSLRQLLKNKRYIGVYTYKGTETPNGIPRIIDDELFYKVQEIMSINKKVPSHNKAKVEYILTTKLFCGLCKEMMTGVSGTSHTGNYYNYYRCNGNKNKQCMKKAIRKEYIEDIVVNACRSLLTTDNIDRIAREIVSIAEKDKDTTIISSIEKAIACNEKKRRNLIIAVSECEIEDIRKDLYNEISDLKAEHSKLIESLESEKSLKISITIPEIKFFLNHLKKDDINNGSDINYRKALINIFVNAIYLYDDKVIIIFNSGDKPITVTDELLSDIENNSEFVFESSSSTI